MRRALALSLIVIGSTSVIGQGQTFRATGDAVLVDVSVTAGNHPVTDLSPRDFSLTDNGVAQQIDDVGLVTLPVDLTLLVDTGSEARFLGRARAIQHDASSVRSLLRAGDRGSFVTVDSQMRWGGAPGDASSRGERGTVLLDAICAAVMTPVDSGRRHMIIAITAGVDTQSLIPAATRARILAKSESPVYVIEGGPVPLAETYVTGRNGGPASDLPPPSIPPGAVWLYGSATIMGDYSAPLHAIADATGGAVFELSQGDAFLEPLRRTLDAFRTTQVLRYRPRDVATTGWHALSVKMNRPGSFNVKARRGYWRD